MKIKEELIEVNEEIKKMKETGVFTEEDEKPIATEVIKLLKTSVKRLYILLIILLFFFIVSIIDSIYQRHVIIGILEDFEIVEETVVEEVIEDNENYDVIQESGDNSNNNFITGDGNEVNN